jgi:uncharacterized protein (DUF1501 family)
MTTRRHALKLLGVAAAFSVAGLPGVVFAQAPGDRRFVLVLLRGALDGLAAVPPVADPRYAGRRGAVALKPPGDAGGCLPLDKLFALNPALAPIHPYWGKGELLFVHAAGNGYRTRSHFDAQDLMESGLSAKGAMSDGWLNRALALLQRGDHRLGLAVGGAVPLVLRGRVPVASWEPAALQDASPEFMAALAQLYRHDPVLGPALGDGLKAQNFSETVLGGDEMGGAKRGFGPKSFAPLASAAGKLLAAPDGPRLAVLEMGGWDTHVNQGTESGRLAENLKGLAEGLDGLAQALGPAWSETVLVAVTEFGRTVAANGTNGTDHGTASVLFVMGGAVKGGRMAGDWPGLDQLQDDRDLRVATDSRRVMKAVLREHLGLDAAALEHKVFPDTAGVAPLSGLLRA